MTQFFTFLGTQSAGILMLLLILVVLLLLLNWLAWIFGWGRFRQPPAGLTSPPNARYARSDDAVKILNALSPLLGLLILLAFALTLGYAMIIGRNPAGFLTFLDTQRGGILIFLLCLIVLVFVLNWLAWMYAHGRFARTLDERFRADRRQDLSYVLSEAAVRIINDFRHLLALVIVLIFALALGYAMIIGRGTIDNMKEALQGVVSTLGGLVGSIIGYYFGESAATAAAARTTPTTTGGTGTGSGMGAQEATPRTLPTPTSPPSPADVPGYTPAPLPPGVL